ncbi:MAG: hypothetical protein AB7Y74_10965 [Syntrophorhabdus sp.]
MHRVMIHPATYQNVSQAVKRAFGLFPFDVRNKKVLIKLNVLRASHPEEANYYAPVSAEGCSGAGGDNGACFNHCGR